MINFVLLLGTIFFCEKLSNSLVFSVVYLSIILVCLGVKTVARIQHDWRVPPKRVNIFYEFVTLAVTALVLVVASIPSSTDADPMLCQLISHSLQDNRVAMTVMALLLGLAIVVLSFAYLVLNTVTVIDRELHTRFCTLVSEERINDYLHMIWARHLMLRRVLSAIVLSCTMNLVFVMTYGTARFAPNRVVTTFLYTFECSCLVMVALKWKKVRSALGSIFFDVNNPGAAN